MASTYSVAEDGSVQGMYRQAGKNTLYNLMPDQNSIFLLDFNQRSFIKHQFKQKMKIPLRATSKQTSNGNIYVVGGMYLDKI